MKKKETITEMIRRIIKEETTDTAWEGEWGGNAPHNANKTLSL